MVALEQELRAAYLDLMKRALTFSLWPEPPVPVEYSNFRRSPAKRLLVSLVARALRRKGFQLVRQHRYTDEERASGRIWPGCADTMIGIHRLENIQYAVETLLAEGIEGDLIETGAWRGGACVFMRALLAAHGARDRRVFVADSFEGLPKPDAARHPADAGDPHHAFSILAVSEESVRANFAKYGLLDDQVVFLKGWFKDTLPKAPIEKLALLRLDGDMYGSTIDALESLYPKLSPGGFCIVDDYAAPAVRQAVGDYWTRQGISPTLMEVDWTGRFWRKER